MNLLELSITCILIISLSACAVQRYGRQNSVSQLEKNELTCKEIAIETSKTEQFLHEVRQKRGKTNAANVLGFLADFGAGNYMEGSEAEASGTRLLHELNALHKEKHCKE